MSFPYQSHIANNPGSHQVSWEQQLWAAFCISTKISICLHPDYVRAQPVKSLLHFSYIKNTVHELPGEKAAAFRDSVLQGRLEKSKFIILWEDRGANLVADTHQC